MRASNSADVKFALMLVTNDATFGGAQKCASLRLLSCLQAVFA
jgi:hypothetical protein